jgi:hypothetical protein
MAKSILSVSLLFAICFLSGCQGIQTVHAQTTPNSVFSGRYIFKSSGFFWRGGQEIPFNEGGTIIADGNGNYTLDSWMNTADNSVSGHNQFSGTYTLDGTLQGQAQQTSGDVMQITMSADGRHGILTSKDSSFTWLAEMYRD